MSTILSQVKSPPKKARINLLLVLFVGLIMLGVSRASVLIPGQDLGGQQGLNLTIAAAAPPAPSKAPVPSGAFVPSNAARWFRSNAGGMALEETPSRVTALSNEYALLVDSAGSTDVPLLLKSYYHTQYIIEVHILYHNGTESRRQWLFRDDKKTTRLVSVLHNRSTTGFQPADSQSVETSASDQPTGRAPWGFIEIYNENYRITKEHMFSDEGVETIVDYSYRGGLLVKAETLRKSAATGDAAGKEEESVRIYTDDYRYNRSSSLRSVERIFHEDAEVVPILITFPNKVLELANEKDFIKGKQPLSFEFFGEDEVHEGFKMVYTTDDQGRILTQALEDGKDNEIWMVHNTWSGRRISSVLRTEGEDVKLIEFEYNEAGDQILERNIRNGVLERTVRAGADGRDVEELYMNGEVVLRAIWEGNRKISEQRIPHGRHEE